MSEIEITVVKGKESYFYHFKSDKGSVECDLSNITDNADRIIIKQNKHEAIPYTHLALKNCNVKELFIDDELLDVTLDNMNVKTIVTFSDIDMIDNVTFDKLYRGIMAEIDESNQGDIILTCPTFGKFISYANKLVSFEYDICIDLIESKTYPLSSKPFLKEEIVQLFRNSSQFFIANY